MKNIIFDESRWPLMVIRYQRGYTMDDWKAHIDKMNQILDRHAHFGWVSDTSEVGSGGTVEQRKLIVENLQRRQQEFATYVKGCATVIKSPLVRGAVTAMTW